MKLKNKVAVITGASRGIGKAIALSFAREGARVIIAARSEREPVPLSGTIHQTADQIRALGGEAIAVKTDVTQEQEVDFMVQKTIKEFKRIDILVNNAATNRPALFKNMPLKYWDMIMTVNLQGSVICTKAVLPIMISQSEGHIINISSLVTREIKHEPMTGLAYDVSKAAINRFTVGLAEELKDYHIAVNALLPDNTATEGWSYLNPTANKSGWQSPAMWGDYAVFVAAQAPAIFSGKLLTLENLQEEKW